MFKNVLNIIYINHNLKQKIRDKLNLLKQIKFIISYFMKFQQIITPLNLKNDDDFKLFIFYTNLDQTIKNQLIYFSSTKTFAQLFDQYITIDQRNYTHHKVKQSAKKSFKHQQLDASSKSHNNNNNNNFKKFNSNLSNKSINYN